MAERNKIDLTICRNNEISFDAGPSDKSYTRRLQVILCYRGIEPETNSQLLGSFKHGQLKIGPVNVAEWRSIFGNHFTVKPISPTEYFRTGVSRDGKNLRNRREVGERIFKAPTAQEFGRIGCQLEASSDLTKRPVSKLL